MVSTVEGANAVLIFTEWHQFRQLNLEALVLLFRQPSCTLLPVPFMILLPSLQQIWRLGDGYEEVLLDG